MEKYVKPKFKKNAFTCPHCGAFSQIKWYENKGIEVAIDNEVFCLLDFGYCFAQCMCCKEIMCFRYQPVDGVGAFNEGVMVYPSQIAIPPVEDMPEHIKKTYKEASLVFGLSPRASCALLRLALQELMVYLKEHYGEYSDLLGSNINEDIKILVRDHGLSPKIQKALDSIRITGNNALHLGELNIDDNQDIAETLFKMINFIIGEMITKPREIEELYEKMPEKERGWVLDRDKNKKQ